MIEALINAEKECKEWTPINHKGSLRPVGEVFKEIQGPDMNSTDSRSAEYTYIIISHDKIFKYRRGDKAYFEWVACINCLGIEILTA